MAGFYSFLYTLARVLGDANAVKKGKVRKRIARRLVVDEFQRVVGVAPEEDGLVGPASSFEEQRDGSGYGAGWDLLGSADEDKGARYAWILATRP